MDKQYEKVWSDARALHSRPVNSINKQSQGNQYCKGLSDTVPFPDAPHTLTQLLN